MSDAGLPTDGVADLVDRPHVLLVTHDAEAIVGRAGLEAHGDQRLLRSLAFTPDRRGRGVSAALVVPRSSTPTDASCFCSRDRYDFFAHLGFHDTDRASVTSRVTTSAEWTSLRPTAATVKTAPN